MPINQVLNPVSTILRLTRAKRSKYYKTFFDVPLDYLKLNYLNNEAKKIGEVSMEVFILHSIYDIKGQRLYTSKIMTM